MRHKRIKNLIVGGALISAFFITQASAYNQEFTHPALTDEIVDFYNLNFTVKLSNQDKSWIIKGSMDEDQGMRPMNHFYDPVHNIGVAGFSTSKQWAMSSGAQSNLAVSNNSIAQSTGVIKSPDDFSYQRVMDDYAHGDRQRAMIGFGHLLHLLEDAGVPDHTRNDPHPPISDLGSPYEHEMAKWNPSNFNIAPELKKEGLKPVVLIKLGDYFDNLAKYSNGNFFSKDTISNNVYNSPTVNNVKNIIVDRKEGFFIVGKDRNGKEFPLAFVKLERNGNSLMIKNISLFDPEIGNFILDGYWDRLSKEVVLNGAGALNLFLTEAEKAKTEYANKPQETNWFAKLLGLIGVEIGQLTTSDGEATSDVSKVSGDSMVTPSPKVTNPSVSPTPLVTKTPITNVTKLSPSVSPSKTPTPTPKPSAMPTSKLTTSDVKTTGRVVINEIAWAGTDASATDEWIELYNTETVPIDISSWELVSSDDSPDIIFLEGTIMQANSYFLIERTDDKAVSDITADLVVGFGQGGLNNAGEMVRLFDSAGTVVDVVGSAGEAWYFGSSDSKNSMERIDAMKAGNSASNWKSFSGTAMSHDIDGNNINGTPKAKNSILVVTPTPTPVIVTLSGGGGGSTPTPTPTPTPSPSPDPAEKININTGSKEQLMTLPGIGDVKSDAIINYRTTNGPFATIEDIQDVSGIGPVTFNNIKDLITVGDVVQNPSAVTNLLATINSPLNVSWSAPNPGGYNIASLSYDLRYSTINFPDANTWDTATRVASSSLPSVGVEGTSQNVSFVIVYEYLKTLYFALKTKVINITTPDVVSDISNIATVNFLSAIDTNAWSMFGKDQYHTSFADNLTGPGPTATISWEFEVGSAPSSLVNVFRSNQISAPCGNGGNNIRLYDYNRNSQGAFPCAGGAGTWNGYFNSSFNNTTFTEFEQVGTLPCGTFEECSASPTTLATTEVVLRVDGWTAPPVGTLNNAVVSADGDIYFGATDGSSNKLIKLDKNGVKKWEYASNVSIGMPAVLSDEVVYFGRIGAGGVLAFTALNSDGSGKWDYDDASTVKAITVSPKGEPYFTYSSGAQDKLAVLNTDGTAKITVSNSGLAGFVPIVLENGNIITTRRVSGNQFFTAYSSAGLELWDVAYTGANGSIQSNPSYDQATSKTYSAVGHDGGSSFGFRMFVIPSDGSVLNTTVIDPASNGSGATMVSITPTKLLVGLDYSWSNPASGSKLFSLNKSDLTISWSFQAEGKINQQIAVDKDGNAYFSTQSGHIYSVDQDGSERWHILTGVGSNISPVLTEDGIIWGYGNRLVSVK